MYRIDLLKRIATQKSNHEDGLNFEQSEDFETLGYFDKLSITKLHSVKDMFAFHPSRVIENYRYLRYSLYAFRQNLVISNFGTAQEDQELLLLQDKKEKCFFLMCLLKFNYNAWNNDITLQRIFEISTNQIREAVHSKKTNENLAIDQKGEENINFQLLFTPGSFDLVLFCSSEKLTPLLCIPHKIRDIQYPSKDSVSRLFINSTSFIILSKKINMVDESEKCSASFKFRLMKPGEKDDWFYSKIKQVLQPKSSTMATLLGDADFQVTVKDVYVKNLVKLLGIGSEPSQELSLTPSNKYYSSYVRSSQSQVFVVLKDEGDACSEEELCAVGEAETNKEGTSDTQRLYNELEELSCEVRRFIPISVTHTVDVLMDLCKSQLNSDYKRITGIKVFEILKTALMIIKENHKSLTSEIISRCFIDIGLIIPMSIQSDSILLENIDGDKVGTPGSTAKFLLAYENLLRKACVSERYLPEKLTLFITIGLADFMNSKQYFKQSPYGSQRLISINFPNISFYNYDYCIPFIFHEVSHYVNVHQTHEKRNLALDDMLKNYVLLNIDSELNRRSNIYENKGFNYKKVKTLLDSVYNHPRVKKLDYLERLDTFQSQWLHMLKSVVVYLVDLVDFNEDVNYSNFLALLIESLTDLANDGDYVQLFARVLKESHADIAMAAFCGLNAVEYLKAHYKYMYENRIADGLEIEKDVGAQNDPGYLLRLAVVVVVLSRKHGIQIQDVKDYLTADEYSFFSNVFVYIDQYRLFIKKLTEYICDVYEELCKRIGNNQCPNCFKENLSDDNILNFLVDNWFEGIAYWRGRGVEL